MKRMLPLVLLALFVVAGCAAENDLLLQRLPSSADGTTPEQAPAPSSETDDAVETPAGPPSDSGDAAEEKPIPIKIPPGSYGSIDADVGIGGQPVGGGVTIQTGPISGGTTQTISGASGTVPKIMCSTFKYGVKIKPSVLSGDPESCKGGISYGLAGIDAWYSFDVTVEPGNAIICPACEDGTMIKEDKLDEETKKMIGTKCVTILDCGEQDGPLICEKEKCVRKQGFPYSAAKTPFILKPAKTTGLPGSGNWELLVNPFRIEQSNKSVKLDFAPRVEGCDPVWKTWTATFTIVQP